METQARIMLDWYQDVASVFKQSNGHTFAIGTVVLKRLAMAVVGCTYYHHIIPRFGGEREISRKEYRGTLKTDSRAIRELLKRLGNLEREYPEISGERLQLDEEEHFIDLAIAIEFAVPYQPTEPYDLAIQEAVLKYAGLLGRPQAMEILEKKDL